MFSARKPRAPRIRSEFDDRRGYSQYHDVCKTQLTSEGRKLARRFDRMGFEYLDVLSPNQAKQMLVMLQERFATNRRKYYSHVRRAWGISDPEFSQSLLREILRDQTDNRIHAFFGSHYLVYWMTFSSTNATAAKQNRSFRWHCDKGPSRHLKLLIYLGAASDHDGTTELVSLEQTDKVHDAGYTFGWSKLRTGDLHEIERRTRCSLVAHSRALEAGQAVVFQPGQVLHRGKAPSFGERPVLTLCLLPSPVPWAGALSAGTMIDIRSEPKWHVSALDLLRRFPN